jgi:hypothetical protein
MYANINEYLGMYTIPKSNLNEKYTILEKEIKEETKTDLQFKKEKTNNIEKFKYKEPEQKEKQNQGLKKDRRIIIR